MDFLSRLWAPLATLVSSVHFSKLDWVFIATLLLGMVHWVAAIVGLGWGVLRLLNEYDEYKLRKLRRLTRRSTDLVDGPTSPDETTRR
jgi:hypothetical protein